MALFAAGLAVSAVAFARGGDGLACKVSGEIFCRSDAVSEELLYGGLALVTVAVLTAVVTTARRT